jgi:HSP20 family protein
VDPNEMKNLMDEMLRNLPDAFKQMGEDPSKGFVAGFNVRMGPDGKPSFNSFGNKPQIKAEGEVPTISTSNREPLTDIFEDGTTIAITMELPGVEKADLDVNMTEDSLELSVDNDLRKYHKRVKLPAKVDPATTKASYNNGVLDVTVQKLETAPSGVKIQID